MYAQKGRFIPAVVWVGFALFAGGGVYFLGLSAWYVLGYVTSDPDNIYRGEFIEGALLSAFLATPLWSVAAGFSFLARHVIPKWLFMAVSVIAGVLLSGFVLMNIAVLALALLSSLQSG